MAWTNERITGMRPELASTEPPPFRAGDLLRITHFSVPNEEGGKVVATDGHRITYVQFPRAALFLATGLRRLAPNRTTSTHPWWFAQCVSSGQVVWIQEMSLGRIYAK